MAKKYRMSSAKQTWAWATYLAGPTPSQGALTYASQKKGWPPGTRRRKVTGAKRKNLRSNPDWITASAVRIRKAGRKLFLDILR